MKKFIAAICACLILASAFAGCSDPLAKSNTSETKASSSSAEKAKKTIKAENYEDNFNGLESYMKDYGYLTKDIIKNANDTKLPKIKGVNYKYGYEYIGAKKGKKYTNNKIVIELYEFEEGKKNEFVDSVKEKGTFTLFDEEVTAYITDNGKYMMVYTDNDIKDDDKTSDAYKTRQGAIKAFEAFKPAKSEKTENETRETKETKTTETSTQASTTETETTETTN